MRQKAGGGIGGEEVADSGLGGEARRHGAGSAADFEDGGAGGIALAAEEGEKVRSFLGEELRRPLIRGAVGVVLLFGVLEGPGGGDMVDSAGSGGGTEEIGERNRHAGYMVPYNRCYAID